MSSPRGNPYAPPAATLSDSHVPDSPFAFATAVFATPPLLALITLVWFPVNALVAFHVATLDAEDVFGAVRAALLPMALLHPLLVGATLEACRRFQNREASTLRILLTSGFRSWSRVFVVAWVANMITILGLLAFVLPGLWLALRYSLVEVVAVAEGAGASASRTRSAAIARSRYGLLIAVHALILAPLLLVFLVAVAGELGVAGARHPLVTAAFDTLADIFDLARFAVFWAIYQAARTAEADFTARTA